MDDIEKEILTNQFAIMSALETLVRENRHHYIYEANQLAKRMEITKKIVKGEGI